jgi:uncharacterized protein (TIGR02246 family)
MRTETVSRPLAGALRTVLSQIGKKQIMRDSATRWPKSPAAFRLLLCVAAVQMFGTGAAAENKTDEAAIRATAAAFVKAFDAGDAKSVASLWTAIGTVADDEGNLFKGRTAIEQQYAALFKQHPTARMQVAIKSIEFPTPTTAIEDGVTQVLTKDNAPPSASRYTAVHVRENGKWLMASVRESSMSVASNFAELQELGWIVGNWAAKSDGAKAQCRIRWIANKSFIQRDFSVQRDGVLASSGTQIVGWDPQSRAIVSWTFDSSGGHGTSRWTARPEGWRIESGGVTSDGVPTTSTDFLIRVPGEDNIFGWRSSDRKLGETKLPDAAEVVFDRVPEKR